MKHLATNGPTSKSIAADQLPSGSRADRRGDGVTTFEATSEMPVSPQDLFDWHLRPGAFVRLMPPWNPVRPVAIPEGLVDGCRAVFDVPAGPIARRWTAVHRVNSDELWFEDDQESGPFRSWIHRHSALDSGETNGSDQSANRPAASVLRDAIRYEMPFGPLGRLGTGFMQRELSRMFRYRHAVTRGDLLAHNRYRSSPRLRIGITGASGLIGSTLSGFFQTGGHEVVRFVRRPAELGAQEAEWSPESGIVPSPDANGLDAIVHLAGSNIGDGRWTAGRKKEIVSSRVDGTAALVRSLKRLERPPRTLVSVSAIGCYGNRGDEELTEGSKFGTGFLPNLCRDWEAACVEAADAGTRVVNPRLGIVLTPRGGALQKMLLPFKLGGGGVVGTGRQFWSWIGLDDVVDGLQACVMDEGF